MAGMSNKDPLPEASKFEGEGMVFRAKLIGSEIVPEARGDKMCQESIQKLKAIVKASKEHKQKINVNVSLEGLKILDQATGNVEHTHEVHRISFISRDVTDSRAFGYVYGPGDGSHKFFAIKTEKAAEALVLSLRDLFQVVYDLKKKEVEEAKKQKDPNVLEIKGVEVGESDDSVVYQVPQNGAPVEGTDAEYAVPKSNKPVEEDSGGNLLDLEDQLTNIEQGIEQMSSFDTLFSSDTPTSPSATTATTSSSSAMDDLAWTATPATTAPASQGLAGLSQTSSPFGIPTISGPGTPFPTSTAAPSPFQSGFPGTSVQPGFGVPSPRSGSPFGTPFGRSSSPFAQPSAGFQQSPGLQPPGLQPPPRTSPNIPVASDPFATDPFGSSASQGIPGGMNQGNMFGAGAGNPFGAPSSSNMFPPSQPPAGNDSGWPNAPADVLAPMKVGGEPDAPAEPEKKKDLFGDLCDIGTFSQEKKTPKDMFKDISTPAKKSLNELKSESLKVAANPSQSPSPQPIFGAGDPFGMATPAAAPVSNDPFGSFPPIPTTQQASDHNTDPFGPLDKTIQKIPDLANTSSDPFDTSNFLHISTPAKTTPSLSSQSPHSNTSADKETISSPAKIVAPASSHQRPRPKAKKPESILSDNRSIDKTIFNDNGFNMPSPDEPPPPLPSNALILSKNAPKPPPRPPSVTGKPSTPSRSNSLKLNSSLSVQSNLNVSSEDHEIGNSTSTDASPVPQTKPRRCNSTASSSDKTENNSPSTTSPISPTSNHNNSAFQRHPVPKPRKSLTKKTNYKANNTLSHPCVSTPPTNEYSNHNLKDFNDNDPFLSSQPNSVDFDSSWDAFDSDTKWNAFASQDPFSCDQNDALASKDPFSSNSNDAFSTDSKNKVSDLKNEILSDTSDPFANDSKWDPFSSDFEKSLPVNSINENKSSESKLI